jgi:hypothetical protein
MVARPVRGLPLKVDNAEVPVKFRKEIAVDVVAK